MTEERQLSLFKGIGFLRKWYRTKGRKPYWIKFGIAKATLKLYSPRKEKSFWQEINHSGARRQYKDIPLFHGLPTMEAWLRWEKRHARVQDAKDREVS